jgi:NAD(P)-dependent dehydrogenase (short-subunit alcohol dehydrogenase family)
MSAAEGRMSGRTAVITGASSGIGEATARLFAAEGAKVALVSRRGEVLERIADEIGGDGVYALAADITDPDDVEAMVARADAEMDGIDVVVNCAGLAIALPLAATDAAVWRSVIDTNLSGSYYVAREVGLRMVAARGGSIVNVGSEMSMMGMQTLVAYCAAKWGLIGMTKALAAELAPTVRVNAICPGPTSTPMFHGYCDSAPDPEAVYEATVARIRLGTVATAESVAEGILYLTANAPFATGATLNLDGGTTI